MAHEHAGNVFPLCSRSLGHHWLVPLDSVHLLWNSESRCAKLCLANLKILQFPGPREGSAQIHPIHPCTDFPAFLTPPLSSRTPHLLATGVAYRDPKHTSRRRPRDPWTPGWGPGLWQANNWELILLSRSLALGKAITANQPRAAVLRDEMELEKYRGEAPGAA